MILFYIFVALLPFQDHYLMNMKLSGDFTVVKAFGVVMIGVALFYGLFRGMPRLFETPQAKALVAFSVWMILSLFFSVNGIVHTGVWYGYEGISFLISALTLYWIVGVLIDTQPKLRWVLLVCSATLGLAGFYIIRGWLGGDDRPGWPFGDANYFALYATTAIPIALATGSVETRKLFRWGAYGGALLGTIGVMLSKSRAGLIGLGVFGLFYLIRERKKTRGIMVVAMIIISLAMLPGTIDRMLHPTKWDNVATALRRELWKAAVQMTIDHPAFGVGPGNTWFMASLPDYMPVWMIAHNTYLEISSGAGVPALAFYIAMLVCAWFSLRRSQRDYHERGNAYLEAISIGLQGSLLAFTLVSTTVSAGFLRFAWFMLFLTMIIRRDSLLHAAPAAAQANNTASKRRWPKLESTGLRNRRPGMANKPIEWKPKVLR